MSRGFGSDNHAPAHPRILAAIAAANEGHQPSYGTDIISERTLLEFRKIFNTECEVFYVFNGTAANSLSLASVCRSYQSVAVSDVSHAHIDECAAPEFAMGGKLIPVKSDFGRISASQLSSLLIRRGDQHFAQLKCVSITQPTELGTVYSREEIRVIASFCQKNHLHLHLDGSRLVHAATSLGVSLAELTTEFGIDVISFGGTKNGFLFGEAVVFLNAKLATDFKYIRKQLGQLPSKTRFIAAQFEAYFKDEFYLNESKRQVQLAQRLARQLSSIDRVQIMYPVQSNAVFVKIPKPWVSKLRSQFFFYIVDENEFIARLMISWDTTESDIDDFCALVKEQ